MHYTLRISMHSSNLISKGRITGALLSVLCSSLVLICLLISGCAPLPNVKDLIDEASLNAQTPEIVGAHGPLSPDQSKAILEKLKREVGETDILQRHLTLEQEIVGSPLVEGNKVTLLENGPATYNAIFAAIRNAKDNINLEIYAFEDDELGSRLANSFIEKQAQGLQVNVMYDSAGSRNTPKSFFEWLKKNGIRVLEFNPINPLHARKGWDINNRDHRKMLVIDGKITFTGGVNISRVYSSSLFAERHKGEPWRDTDVQIEGPAVAEFQKIFIETWKQQKGKPLSPRNYFPQLTKKGNEIVRVIGSSYDDPLNLIYVTLISAITNAENSVHLTIAYFAPDPQMLRVLKDAARRGVDVKLILPSNTDIVPVLYAGHSHYSELLKAGVKIYERQDVLLHAKTAVIDEVWSTVGSTNLDWRSFVYDDEINAVVLGWEFAAQMEAVFAKDLQNSRQINEKEWAHRPLGAHIKEWMARVWERML
jgi:cardiolipin synthase A/B